MTIARRMAAVESSLTPTQLVLRWLAEAHAYGGFEAYGRALLDFEADDLPISRLCREAERSTRATVRSRVPEKIKQAIDKALRETLFRYLLVLRINVAAHELLDQERIMQAMFAAHLALLASASEKERAEEGHREWLATILEGLLGRVAELDAAAGARTAAEARYLDGCPALFPDAVEAWEAQVKTTREIAAMAMRLAEIEEVDTPLADEEALAERVDQLLADLTEPAKAIALEKLDEGKRGFAIAVGWLRGKLEPDLSPGKHTL